MIEGARAHLRATPPECKMENKMPEVEQTVWGIHGGRAGDAGSPPVHGVGAGSIDALDACLRRQLGSLEAKRLRLIRRFQSPPAMYGAGVRSITRVPFVMLDAAGLVDDESPRAGWLLRWLTGIGSLALTAAAVVKALRDLGWITI